MSNATSIFGTPRDAGGIPVSSKCASDLLSSAISRSPCSTCTLTNDWLSTVVEKISVARAGSDVLCGRIRACVPPRLYRRFPGRFPLRSELRLFLRDLQVAGLAISSRRKEGQVDLG